MLWFPDTSVLCNFAAVGAPAHIKEYIGDRGLWARSIEAEVHASTAHVPALQQIIDETWFPPSIAANGEGEQRRVDSFRRIHMFGDPMIPKEHLGESETFVLMTRDEYRDSTFLTDDGEAFRLMAKMGVRTADTVDVLSELVARHSITSTTAFDLVLRMEDAKRELRRLPKTPAEFE